MRIDKGSALQALAREESALARQMALCSLQYARIGGFSLLGMSGMGARALQGKIRAQRSVLNAHRGLYSALSAADIRNQFHVMALPETSPGVLDTAVAQRRIDEAEAKIRSLRRTCSTRVSAARASNEKILSSADPIVGAILDITGISRYFDAQIMAQQAIIRLNELILQRAEEYRRYSRRLYSSIDLGAVNRATATVDNYLNTGQWSSAGWTISSGLGLLWTGLKKFATNKVKGEGALISGTASIGDEKTGASATGEVGYGSWSVKPYGSYKDTGGDDGDESTKLGVGVKAKGEVGAAKGKVEANVGGVLHGDAEGKVLVGAVEGEIGATLYKNGKFDPSLGAKASASASVLEGEANVRTGSKNYNYHAKAEGQVLTANAEAGVSVGKEGVEAKAEAGAYLAKGEVSGGFTFFGIKVDIGLEGDAGGVGAKAGGKVSSTGAEGELGAGLGLGAGVSFKVDWSGVGEAFDGACKNVESAWNNIKKIKLW